MPIGDNRNLVTDTNGSVLDPLYQAQSPVQPSQPSIASMLGWPSVAQGVQVAGDIVPFPHELARPPSGDPVGPQAGPHNVLQMDPLAGGVPQGASPTGSFKGKVDWARFDRELEKMIMQKGPEQSQKEMDEITSFAKGLQDLVKKNTQKIKELRASLPAGYKEPSIAGEVAEGVMKGKINILHPEDKQKLTVKTFDPLEDAVPFTGNLPKHAEEMFSEGGAAIFKLQKPGRWPTFVAISPTSEAYQFKDFEKAKRWVAPPPVMRPDPPLDPNEPPPWE